MEESKEFCLYEVQPGDSLSGIAAHFGYVTPSQLARLNHLPLMGCGLSPVMPGQSLVIPTELHCLNNINKTRQIPGMALPVENKTKNSEIIGSNFQFAIEPFFYTSVHSNRLVTDSSEDDECQFIKVKAIRIIKCDDVVDGVLLITPESLCFDAGKTALAQKEAYLGSHITDDPTSCPNQPHCEFSCCEIPKELLNLGLCVPLQCIVSMSTLRQDELDSVMKSGSRSSALVSPTTNCPDTLLDKASVLPVENTKNPELDTQINESVIPAKSPNSSTDEPVLQADESVDLKIESIPQTLSDQIQNINLDQQEVVENGTKPPDYFLRIVLQEDQYYIFQLSMDNLTKVYYFLLRSGVGLPKPLLLSSNKSVPNSSSLPIDDAETKLSKSSKNCRDDNSRRSLVEEALEQMEASDGTVELLGGKSSILTDSMLKDLSTNLRIHWIGSNLNLVYKAEDDGYCLNTIYRKCKDFDSGGFVLVIRDTMGTVFGAFLSDPMRCNKHFYGTGECSLFHWNPTFKQYAWSKKNYFFMRGSYKSFQIGGQSGRNAIWFDEALKYGRSESTDTFDNPVLCGIMPTFQLVEPKPPMDEDETTSSNDSPSKQKPLTSSALFMIDLMELWHLVS